MADDNSGWEEKTRNSNLWDLSGVHDIPASDATGAAELPLVAEAATTSQESLQEKSCPEQNWKRQAMPSVSEDKSQSAGECRGRSG